MSAFAQRLNQLRKENDLSLEEFAQKFNTYRSTIWRYEKGQRQPPIDFVRDIAVHFGVSMDWLAGTSDIKEPNINSQSLSDLFNSLSDSKKVEAYNFIKYLKSTDNKLPQNNCQILGQTAAGQPLEYVDSFVEETNTNAPENADYGLAVKGDSMEPLIKNGSTVWVKQQPCVENGEIAIIEIDGSVTCKKVYKMNGHLELHSINPKYKPMVIGKGEVRILGKVIL